MSKNDNVESDLAIAIPFPYERSKRKWNELRNDDGSHLSADRRHSYRRSCILSRVLETIVTCSSSKAHLSLVGS